MPPMMVSWREYGERGRGGGGIYTVDIARAMLACVGMAQVAMLRRIRMLPLSLPLQQPQWRRRRRQQQQPPLGVMRKKMAARAASMRVDKSVLTYSSIYSHLNLQPFLSTFSTVSIKVIMQSYSVQKYRHSTLKRKTKYFAYLTEFIKIMKA